MPTWIYYVLALCIVALTAAVVAALVYVAAAVRRAERVLHAVQGEIERDVPPLLVGVRELTDELRLLSHEATAELDRIGQITGRVQEVADGAARLLTALSGLTRAGQLIGIVAGVKAFVDVFVLGCGSTGIVMSRRAIGVYLGVSLRPCGRGRAYSAPARARTRSSSPHAAATSPSGAGPRGRGADPGREGWQEPRDVEEQTQRL